MQTYTVVHTKAYNTATVFDRINDYLLEKDQSFLDDVNRCVDVYQEDPIKGIDEALKVFKDKVMPDTYKHAMPPHKWLDIIFKNGALYNVLECGGRRVEMETCGSNFSPPFQMYPEVNKLSWIAFGSQINKIFRERLFNPMRAGVKVTKDDFYIVDREDAEKDFKALSSYVCKDIVSKYKACGEFEHLEGDLTCEVSDIESSYLHIVTLINNAKKQGIAFPGWKVFHPFICGDYYIPKGERIFLKDVGFSSKGKPIVKVSTRDEKIFHIELRELTSTFFRESNRQDVMTFKRHILRLSSVFSVLAKFYDIEKELLTYRKSKVSINKTDYSKIFEEYNNNVNKIKKDPTAIVEEKQEEKDDSYDEDFGSW